MRMALPRAGLALVAAGTLGLVTPAGAQPLPVAGGPPVPVEQAPPAEVPPDQLEAQGRLLEMKVELALMADRATFPYHLGARAGGDRLEVRGYIPTEVVRQRALRVARANCPLNVTDGLRTHPHMVMRSGGGPPVQLQSAAQEVLQEALPEHAKEFAVKARANGEVTVSGSVPSYEEKLLASHCLRKVPGCSAVVNQLTVANVTKDGRQYTKVSTDGEQMVPVDAAEGPPAGTLIGPPTEPQLEVPPPASGHQAEGKPSPWIVPPGPGGGKVVGSLGSPYSPRPVPTVTKTGEKAAVVGMTSAPAERPAVSSTSSRWAPPTDRAPAGDYARPSPAFAGTPDTGRKEWAPPADVAPSSPGPVMGTAELDPPDEAPPPSPPKEEAMKPAAARPVPPVVMSGGWAPPEPVAPPAPKPEPAAGASAKPPHAAPPAFVPGPRATAEASYVTNGVAVFMDSDPAPQVPSRPGPTSLQARMTRAIENTCGSAAREVEVIVRSNNSLLVRFKVHSATEGERLSQQVLQMPELGPYQVNLEVKVSP